MLRKKLIIMGFFAFGCCVMHVQGSDNDLALDDAFPEFEDCSTERAWPTQPAACTTNENNLTDRRIRFNPFMCQEAIMKFDTPTTENYNKLSKERQTYVQFFVTNAAIEGRLPTKDELLWIKTLKDYRNVLATCAQLVMDNNAALGDKQKQALSTFIDLDREEK